MKEFKFSFFNLEVTEKKPSSGSNAIEKSSPNTEENPLFRPTPKIDELPDLILKKIFSACDLAVVNSVCKRWNNIVNKQIGRTIVLDYAPFLSYLQSLQMPQDSYEQHFLKQFQKLGVGTRKIKFALVHTQQGRVAAPSSSNNLITSNPSSTIRQEGWFQKFQRPTLSLQSKIYLKYLQLKSATKRNVFQHFQGSSGFGLQHSLLQSICIEYPPSSILLKEIFTKCSHLKELTLISQLLEFLPESKVTNVIIPSLEHLSLPLALSSFQNFEIEKENGAIAFLSHNRFPRLKALKLELGIVRHPFLELVIGKPSSARRDAIAGLLRAILNFLSKHSNLEKLVCPQVFLECDDKYADLSLEQLVKQGASGLHCIGNFWRGTVNDLSKRALTISASLKKLKTVQISQMSIVNGGKVNVCPAHVQRGPQAVLWQNFLRGQTNNQKISIGIPGLPFSIIESICKNNATHLKALQITHFMNDETSGGNELIYCNCLAQCRKLEKVVLSGTSSLRFETQPQPTTTQLPCLVLAGVTAFPKQLKQLTISNIKLRYNDANFVLHELPALQKVKFICVGKEGLFGVPVTTFRNLINERRLKRMVFLDSINGPLWFESIKLNPTKKLPIVKMRQGEKTVTWVDLALNIYTGQYEQNQIDQFNNELGMLEE